MATEKLYWRDAYLKAFDTTVTRAEGNSLVLDKTIFYATSGGQPNDTGTITIAGNSFRVTDVRERDGDIIHTTDKSVDGPSGTIAHCEIDWERRYRLMRHHTALHVLSAVMVTKYDPDSRSTGGQIYEDHARMDFDMQTLNRELAQRIIDDTNAMVQEDRRVFARELTQAEALAIPNLSRTVPGMELIRKLDRIRVIEIEKLDVQIDGGTHVASTKEVGRLRMTKFENNGKHNKRIEFSLEE